LPRAWFDGGLPIMPHPWSLSMRPRCRMSPHSH
jgi:hypothetical protein